MWLLQTDGLLRCDFFLLVPLLGFGWLVFVFSGNFC